MSKSISQASHKGTANHICNVKGGAEQLDAELSWQPLYYGCGNECWSAELTGCADQHKAFSVTALSPDRLEMLISTYSGVDPFPSVLRLFFARVAPDETDRSGEPSAVTVSSAAELISALHDGVEITLKSGEYDISGQLDEFSLPGWSYIGDSRGKHGLFAGYSGSGSELVISGMSNITLRSEDPSAPARIVCSSPDASVLTLYGCSGISLENLVLTHSVTAQPIAGSVLTAEYSSSVSITGCELSGGGAYALECYNCPGLYVSSGVIHDCMYGCAVLSACSSAEIYDTRFFSCSGSAAFDADDSEVLFSSCVFSELGGSLISVNDKSKIRFDRCELDPAALSSLEADEHFGGSVLSFSADDPSPEEGGED